MRAIFVTLFKGLIEGYFKESIMGKAIEKELISVEFVTPRDFSRDKHKKTDEYLVGGGAGLLFSPQPLCDCIEHLKSKYSNAKVIIPIPSAKPFVQNDAKRLSSEREIIFVCGRYDGIDERVVELYADEVFCVGDFILSGGELASACIFDAIARNIAGVLGNDESMSEESFDENLLEAPSFTKPNIFKNIGVPSEFLKGNHGSIRTLKTGLAEAKTSYFRPDMYEKYMKTKKDNYSKDKR